MKPQSLLERANVITLVFLVYAIVGGILCATGGIDFDSYGTKLVAFGAAVGAVRGYLAGKRIDKAPTSTAQIPGEDDPTTGLTPAELTDETPVEPDGTDFAKDPGPVNVGPEAPSGTHS